MPYSPEDHEICPCCGTHFGYDDFRRSHRELRNAWLASGGQWFSPVHSRPLNWDPFLQVSLAGYDSDVQKPDSPDTENTVRRSETGELVMCAGEWVDY